MLRPGGLLLDGDHFASTPSSPRPWPGSTRRCAGARTSGASPAGIRKAGAAGGTRSRPTRSLAAPAAEAPRRRVDAGHHDSESTQLATHVDALKAAGFAEVGTLWQRGDNRLLCAVTPGR